ncbi:MULTISPECIES: tRNA pseudouridine(55) synthase TruB [Aeromonas]|jgi:tRNA pseudouridine55 synthase|uniref:tRNA pseudouridine synthase B n=1 Tax=Aeromonas media TaxID=651 RepID=A0A6M4YZT1_AERME|nr:MULTISPECIES: tRNA pseudouridine(55) synthase TruB [Aeromonas]MBP6071450.1 tRNA pseudouridine(55) synthase TruB [Aeromonas sp.]MBL0513006.1 tRNA pseudouridine(55) synthase TruB [Aeromonas media]MBP9677661.1 tRNA pseudouridine(55) synthase TruB [Aeromonas sp.]MBS4639026.1 tRNA pseudouridine(55) synthase TruB [Aeromonas media]MBV7469700.1 tRNA pseudouridine(55) synthase TruB [Aeromonas sp. sif0611]
MSRRRRFKGRDVHGILLLDKPTGLTSNDVLQKVKRIYNAAKAGHTGALDPLATGMLPICLGEATKFSQYLLEADKRYEVTAKLGERTNTSDSDGEVVSTRPVNVAVGTLIEALDQFRGPIMQVPSMYSALKHNGRPLYEYAREGIEIEREARPITVFELKLLSFEGDEVRLEVHCSKGTYIRSLVDDLGEVLGCGAHVTQLRRTQVASYPYDRMLTLEQLECIFEQAKAESIPPREQLDPLLLPMDTAVASLPEVNMLTAVAAYVNQGQAVQVAGAPQSGQVRMTVGPEREFIGVGEIDDEGRVAPKRLVRYHDDRDEE